MEEEKLPSLEDAEREVLAQTVSENRATVSLIERAMNLFLSGLNILEGKQPKEDVDWLLLYLVIRAVNSARWARECIVRGYYTQALTLTRTVEEDWLTAAYVGKHPEATKYWFEEKYTEYPACKEIPTFAKMRKALGLSGEVYGLLSQFAHPRYRAFAFIVEDRGSTNYLRLGPHYDHDQFIGACDALLRVIPSMHRILELLLRRLLPGHDEDWINQRAQMRDEIMSWIDAVGREVGEPTHLED